MATVKSNEYRRAFTEGQEAVRRQPRYSPRNPYEEETEPELYDAWDAGADSAGWNDIYTNGVYMG